MPKYDDDSSSPLPQTKCYITTHDKEGKAVFYQRASGSDDVALRRLGVAGFNVLYTTSELPADYENDKDIDQFFNTKGVIPVSIAGGSVVRMVDLAPGGVSPMHRTKSLDYGVVLSGEVELVLEDLDKGPVRVMKIGDVSIQRATMHAWRNPSKTEWSRMLYVLLDAKSFGKDHEEELDGLEMPGQ
jgi:quercetin dioxygenase-like cupin family protein